MELPATREPARSRTISLPGIPSWVVVWGGWLGGSFLLVWILGIIWWALLSPAATAPAVEEFNILRGTAAAIERGDAAFLPSALSVRPGGRLLIRNQDTVDHTVGNATIPPGATAELSAPEDGSGFSCSIHPSGYLGISLKERPSFLTTLVPGVFGGMPLGLLAALATLATRKLNIS